MLSVCNTAVCVLEKMLLLDPEQRASASEALDLPFFSEFRDTEEETEALPYDQTMDNTDLPLDQWKRKTGERGGFRLEAAQMTFFSVVAVPNVCQKRSLKILLLVHRRCHFLQVHEETIRGLNCLIHHPLFCLCTGHTFTEILTFRPPKDSRETSL